VIAAILYQDFKAAHRQKQQNIQVEDVSKGHGEHTPENRNFVSQTHSVIREIRIFFAIHARFFDARHGHSDMFFIERVHSIHARSLRLEPEASRIFCLHRQSLSLHPPHHYSHRLVPNANGFRVFWTEGRANEQRADESIFMNALVPYFSTVTRKISIWVAR